MNPRDVPTSDWGLYYNHSFMTHEDIGLVEVYSNNGALTVRRPGRDSDFTAVNHDKLDCLWPQSRTLNITRGAIYVTRRPVRSARRSITLEHYFIAWQEFPSFSSGINHSIVRSLVYPPEYPVLDSAVAALNNGQYTSVGISRDIILCKDAEEGYAVVYAGEPAGRLVPDTLGFCFETSVSSSPAAKRAAFRLQKEGFLCQ